MSVDHTDPHFREWLHDMLGCGPVSITFTKTDGSERVMKCTLEEGVVPVYEKKTSRVKVKNDEMLSVWDLDKQAWRSFRFDSLKHVQVELP